MSALETPDSPELDAKINTVLNGYERSDKIISRAQHQRKALKETQVAAVKQAAKNAHLAVQGRLSRETFGQIEEALERRDAKRLTHSALALTPDVHETRSKRKRKKHGTRRKHLPWPEVLELLLEVDMDYTDKAVQTKSGYGQTQLYNYVKQFKAQTPPNQKLGQPKRFPDPLKEELGKVLKNNPVLDAHSHTLIQKASLLHHKLEKPGKVWKPPSQDTCRDLINSLQGAPRQGQLQDARRALACSTIASFFSFSCAMESVRMQCGSIPKRQAVVQQQWVLDESKLSSVYEQPPPVEHVAEDERQFVKRRVWSLDATTGKINDFDKILLQVMGTETMNVVGVEGLMQQYKMYFACNASGDKMSPVIGVRARENVHAIKGKPLVYTITDEEWCRQFYGWQDAPPKIVVYHKDDHRMFIDIFLQEVLNKVLEAEWEELSSSGMHVCACARVS